MKTVKSNFFEIRGHLVIGPTDGGFAVKQGNLLEESVLPRLNTKLQGRRIILLTPHIFSSYIGCDYVESCIAHVHYHDAEGEGHMLKQFDQYLQFTRSGNQWKIEEPPPATLADQLNFFLNQHPELELVRPYYGEGNAIMHGDENMISHQVLFAEVKEKEKAKAPTAKDLEKIKAESQGVV